MPEHRPQGSLVCVGLGMTLGAHISPLSRSHIEQADVVFCGASHALVETWVKQMHTDVRSLQVYYQEGKDRRETYRQMVDAMLNEVRAGKRVVGAFYGHPGVFALAPHRAIEQAKREGFAAHMEPGISAEACLYADMGIDPGRVGCQHYEASQFMIYQRQIDTSAYLILWQIGIAGDQTLQRFSSSQAHRQVLQQVLLDRYTADHQVAIYEAPTLPVHEPRISWCALGELAAQSIMQHSTLVVPPSRLATPNSAIRALLHGLDQDEMG